MAVLTMATRLQVGGSCSELGGGGARHIEFVNVAAYTGGAVLLLETEQNTARWLAAMLVDRVRCTEPRPSRRMVTRCAM